MENFSRQSQEVTDTDATDAKPKSKEELAAEYDLPADASWSEIDAHTAAKVRADAAAEYDLPADASWSEIDAHTAAKVRADAAAEYDLPADASWSEIDAHTAAKHSIGGTALQ